jgi:hypothetical protein
MMGVAMAEQDEGSGPEPAKSGLPGKVSTARNVIGVVLLVLLSAIAYREWDANRRSAAGIFRLNQALAREEGDLLSMDQVEGLLGRGPDGPGVAQDEELRVTYTWRGVFRKYPVVAVYTRNSRPALLRTE